MDNGANGRVKGDGIGDTKLPHQGVDYYPFVNPSVILSDDGVGSDDDFWISNSLCRTLSIILIILLFILFFILRKILKKKKPSN